LRLVKLYGIILLIAGTLPGVCQQETNSVDPGAVTPNPFELSNIRPKFFEFNFRTLPSVGSYPYGEMKDVDRFETNRLIDVKLTVPILFKKKVKVLAQVRHKNELLNLGEIEDIYDKDLTLKNTGVVLLYKIKLQNQFFLAGHISGALKADKYHYQNFTSILDYNSSFIFGKEDRDRNGRLGVGLILGNSLGRFNVAPIIIYDKQFSRNWMLEMRLPKEVTVRRIVKPDNFYLLGSVEASGAAYFLKDNVYPGIPDVEFRRTALDISLGLEKEIHDWLWFGCQAGITQPLRSSLVRAGQPTRSRIHNLQQQFSPYASVSIFAVPPRKLFNKAR
jgi:hypothetical protein